MLHKLNNFLLSAALLLLPVSTVFIISETYVGGYKFQYGTAAIFATQILIALVAGSRLIQWLKELKEKNKPDYKIFKADKVRLVLVVCLWLLALWSGLSLIWAGEKFIALFYWIGLLEGMVLFFLILTSGLRLRTVSWLVFASGIAQAAFATIEFFFQSAWQSKYLGLIGHAPADAGALAVESGGRWLRPYGLVNDPNLLGAFMAVSLFSGIWLYNKTEKRYSKLAILAGLAICSSALVFSFSRGAWAGAVAGIIIYIIVSAPTRIKFKSILPPLAVIFFAVCALAAIYLPMVQSRLLARGRLENISIASRMELGRQGAGIIASNPWLGTGIGNYSHELMRLRPGLPAYDYRPVHNLYMLILSELGAVGIILFAGFLGTTSYISYKRGNLIYFSLLAGLLAMAVFDQYFWMAWQGEGLFWLVAALALVPEA